MPRRKVRKKGSARGGDSSEGDTEETGSVVSSHLSEPDSILEEGPELADNVRVDETDAQERFEEKIKEYIDGTTQKSVNGRKDCLEGLKKSLSRKVLTDFIEQRKVTISDCVERCIKKGKSEEQALAASVGTLLLIQLGAGDDSEAIFNDLLPLLKTTLADKTVAPKGRASCALFLGLGCFLAADNYETVLDCMVALEHVFSLSYLKGDGTVPSHTPAVTALHCAALSAWTLLLSIAPPARVPQLVDSHLGKLPTLLHSDDVNLRIEAGESIAMFYELAREQNEDFDMDNVDELLVTLRGLATDSNKYRAKKDRRQQRSSFRDIMRTIEDNDIPHEIIKFGPEILELDGWVKKQQYVAFREVLGSGTNIHLQENLLLRDIFGLGAPIITSGPGAPKRANRSERHHYNSQAFKARTKVRSKQRDKRSYNPS
ncbi:interferon-related developmental regulator 2-like [Acanthaster planci]|uniref:Interferon-related developmental regulator 2-like n=1 Tax=Acanthaster planci TaxID=133434 RepID=A0A8B7Z207_ACAPL|nr:interferon-related developmental regulator 2-like [Acanthaster planci]